MQVRAVEFLYQSCVESHQYKAPEAGNAADIHTLQLLTQYAADSWRTLPAPWLSWYVRFITEVALGSKVPRAQQTHVPTCSLVNLVLDIWQHRGAEQTAALPRNDSRALYRCAPICPTWPTRVDLQKTTHLKCCHLGEDT
jgi:hypothetical protein